MNFPQLAKLCWLLQAMGNIHAAVCIFLLTVMGLSLGVKDGKEVALLPIA